MRLRKVDRDCGHGVMWGNRPRPIHVNPDLDRDHAVGWAVTIQEYFDHHGEMPPGYSPGFPVPDDLIIPPNNPSGYDEDGRPWYENEAGRLAPVVQHATQELNWDHAMNVREVERYADDADKKEKQMNDLEKLENERMALDARITELSAKRDKMPKEPTDPEAVLWFKLNYINNGVPGDSFIYVTFHTPKGWYISRSTGVKGPHSWDAICDYFYDSPRRVVSESWIATGWKPFSGNDAS